MPYLVLFGAGFAAGIYASNKVENVAMFAMTAAAIYAGGKYAKAW